MTKLEQIQKDLRKCQKDLYDELTLPKYKHVRNILSESHSELLKSIGLIRHFNEEWNK